MDAISGQRDCLARCGYSSELAAEAEQFLIRVFSGGCFTEVPDSAVVAAMHILAGVCWVQPTGEQLEAAEIAAANARKSSLDQERDRTASSSVSPRLRGEQ